MEASRQATERIVKNVSPVERLYKSLRGAADFLRRHACGQGDEEPRLPEEITSNSSAGLSTSGRRPGSGVVSPTAEPLVTETAELVHLHSRRDGPRGRHYRPCRRHLKKNERILPTTMCQKTRKSGQSGQILRKTDFKTPAKEGEVPRSYGSRLTWALPVQRPLAEPPLGRRPASAPQSGSARV